MKKLKCESCGGNLKIDDNKEYATCPFCETKYKLNDDLTIKVKLDDDTKKMIKGGAKIFGAFTIASFIPFIIVSLVILTMIVVGVIFGIKEVGKQQVSNFNFKFTYGSGTQPTIFVNNTINDVVESNKKNKRKITIKYGDKETQDEKEINEIKHSLNKNQYEVSYSYDEKGYITTITIEDIK